MEKGVVPPTKMGEENSAAPTFLCVGRQDVGPTKKKADNKEADTKKRVINAFNAGATTPEAVNGLSAVPGGEVQGDRDDSAMAMPVRIS